MQIRTNIIVIIVMFLSMITFKQSNAQLANSPWPCLQQNAQHTGQSPYAGPDYPTLAWKFKIDQGVNGSPAIGQDGTIYIPGMDSCLYAFGTQGKIEWKYKCESKLKGVPTIDNFGTIYVASTVSSWGSDIAKLYAINRDGSLKWAIPLGGKEISNPSIGKDGTIYVGTYDTNQNFYRVYSLYPSGGEKWNFDVVGPVGTTAIGSDGNIYVGAGSGATSPYTGAIYSFYSNGSLRWRNENFKQGYYYGEGRYPVIHSDHTVIVDDANGISAIQSNGDTKWKFNPSGWTHSKPALSSDGTVYFVHSTGGLYSTNSDSLFALNQDGSRKWTYFIGTETSPPIIDNRGIVWVATKEGKLYAINYDGDLKWSGYVAGGKINELALDENGILYFTSSDNNLYAYFSPDSSIIPDLQVTKILYDPLDGVNVGAQANLTAEIEELSGTGNARCQIIFYHTNINPNNIIGSAYAFVPVGLKGYAEVVWNTNNLPVGTYNIFAVITSSNPPENLTENNQFQSSYNLLPSIKQRLSSGSDTIWVDPGTYKENLVFRKNVVVKSTKGPHSTIIDGVSENYVVLFNELDSTAVIDGFTIKGGIRGVDFQRGGGVVRNCIIKNNRDGIYNIGSMVYTDPIIENNIITENTRYAMDTNNSWALFNKNTVVKNGGGVNGYGFYSGSPDIVNCIFWDNGDDLIGSAQAIYSCIQNGDPGTGNISANPLFVDAEHGDYHLQQGSPCINAGHPDPSFNDPDGSRADMGAFNYSFGTSVHSPKESTLPEKYHLAQNYPNPFNPVTTIEYQLPQGTQVSLRIFNIAGKLVKSLIEGKQSAGYHKIQWDGSDESGNSVAGGLYLYHLKADGFSQSNKMVLIR